MSQPSALNFNPYNGARAPNLSARNLREEHPTTPWLYNPWNGKWRASGDVASDPLGLLIWDDLWGPMPAATYAPAATLPGGYVELEPRKHAHYFKPCPFDQVDVYRVLQLFAVTDPCLQHAVKKLLVAGGRGAGKDITRDVQEAIDTLQRWQEMRQEELPPK